MNSVNYTQMSDNQLKKYFIKNRHDKAALQAYLNRRHQRSNKVIATFKDSDFNDKILTAIRKQMSHNP